MATITTTQMAPQARRRRQRQVFLICGILSSLLYVATIVLAPIRWQGYSSISQMVGVGNLFMLLAIGSAATAFGKRFRLYSITTIVLLVVGSVLSFLDIPRVAANLPTPWMGMTERINIFAYMLWVVVLAIDLLRAQVERPQTGSSGSRDSG
jgi:hypothetical protein